MELLPKIWQGRIQKYWDKTMPADYPKSSSFFSLNFKEEVKAEIEQFEEDLAAGTGVASSFIPEGDFLDHYFGTYNVSGLTGVETLLSPENVGSSDIVAVHYNEEINGWEAIENAHVVNGYVWATLESFSPIAILGVAKEIENLSSIDGLVGNNFIVCKGNPCVMCTESDPESGEDKVYVVNTKSNFKIEVPSGSTVIAGSVDGSNISITNLTVKGVESDAKIIAGSFYYSEENSVSAEIDSIILNIEDSTIAKVTGASSMCRTKELNYNFKNSTITSFIGTAESYNTPKNKDVNGPEPSLESLNCVRNANINLDNVTTVYLFCSGNSGYTFVESSNVIVNNSTIDYCITGGSNGITDNCILAANESTFTLFQTVNRGTVKNVNASLSSCSVSSLYYGADDNAEDDGVIEKELIELNDTTCDILGGYTAGESMTSEDIKNIIEYIRVSITMEGPIVTITGEVRELLGDKLIYV